MYPGELSFSEPTYQCHMGNNVSANLPTNVPWGTTFQRNYLQMFPGELSFSEPNLPMSPGELSFSEPTYQ